MKNFEMVTKAMDLGYELNNIPTLEGAPCRRAFTLVRSIINHLGYDSEAVFQLLIRAGQHDPAFVKEMCERVESDMREIARQNAMVYCAERDLYVDPF